MWAWRLRGTRYCYVSINPVTVICLIRLVLLIVRLFTRPMYMFVSLHMYDLCHIYFAIDNIIDRWKRNIQLMQTFDWCFVNTAVFYEPPVLQEAPIKIISYEDCRKTWQDVSPTGNVCLYNSVNSGCMVSQLKLHAQINFNHIHEFFWEKVSIIYLQDEPYCFHRVTLVAHWPATRMANGG